MNVAATPLNLVVNKSASPREEKTERSEEELYRMKHDLLKEKYTYIEESNNLLRNRLYHVKKEISHLARLKRVLCNRLLALNDVFFDTHLEIPDDDVTLKEEPPKKKKKPTAPPKDPLSAEARANEEQMKQRIGPLIESIITDCRREQAQQLSQTAMPRNRSASLAARPSLPPSSSSCEQPSTSGLGSSQGSRAAPLDLSTSAARYHPSAGGPNSETLLDSPQSSSTTACSTPQPFQSSSMGATLRVPSASADAMSTHLPASSSRGPTPTASMNAAGFNPSSHTHLNVHHQQHSQTPTVHQLAVHSGLDAAIDGPSSSTQTSSSISTPSSQSPAQDSTPSTRAPSPPVRLNYVKTEVVMPLKQEEPDKALERQQQ